VPAHPRAQEEKSDLRINGEPVRNAIGVPIPDRSGAQRLNTVPPPVPPGVSLAHGGTANVVTTNPPAAPRLASPGAKPFATVTGANRAAINGTGLTHPGTGPGKVGGSAAFAAGSLSGTSFRPKH
jgi:hypothetical protein